MSDGRLTDAWRAGRLGLGRTMTARSSMPSSPTLRLPIGLGLAALLAACQPAASGSAGPSGMSVSGAPSYEGAAGGPAAVRFQPVATGLHAPIGITNAADSSGRMFVNEQAGTIRVLGRGGSPQGDLFGDLRDRVLTGAERGLLGLAFHPQFAANRRLFVDYTRRPDGNIVVAEFRASADGRHLDPSSERVLLTIEHSQFSNHNGGQLGFGPDGYLYVAVGDPSRSAQDTGTLLGKILRIDVNSAPSAGRAYAIPASNPFARGGGAPEVWAYGLRNPWRFSFDPPSGDLYIADVGQSAWEEIDRQPGDAPGGANYGWPVMEGRHCLTQSGCDAARYVAPIAEYGHDLGCVITGGYVYRGHGQPALDGVYLFADYCSGRVFGLQVDEGAVTPRQLLQAEPGLASFGVDESGELYVANANTGAIYKIVA